MFTLNFFEYCGDLAAVILRFLCLLKMASAQPSRYYTAEEVVDMLDVSDSQFTFFETSICSRSVPIRSVLVDSSPVVFFIDCRYGWIVFRCAPVIQ